MTKKSKKLKWERVGDSYNLRVLNKNYVNPNKLRKMLESVERIYPDYNKTFSKKASVLFERWFNELEQPLDGAAYALLSNWFLTESPAGKKTRAQHALELWNVIFSAVPIRRLTSPDSNDKIQEEEFKLWWPKQQKCQEEG